MLVIEYILNSVQKETRSVIRYRNKGFKALSYQDPSQGSDGNTSRFQAITKNRSVFISALITVFLFFWVISGVIFEDSTEIETNSIADQGRDGKVFRVITADVDQKLHSRVLRAQGRTQAVRSVRLAAETAGNISRRAVAKGDFVKKGQVICEIDVGARRAQYDEASAIRDARAIDYSAAKKLFEKGHTSKSQVASAKANYDASLAMTKARQVELSRTKIKAPFDGIVDRLPVEIGDFISMGMPCATLLDKDPMLAIGHVAENDIALIVKGAEAEIILATGETLNGVVRYVAESPNTLTRTFQVEVEIPNPDLTIRDGVSADILLQSGKVMASNIPQSAITLNDTGEIGVRTVRNGRVKFLPIEFISDGLDGAWVTGLASTETLITVGQEFVIEGEAVEVDEPGKKTLTQFSENADAKVE